MKIYIPLYLREIPVLSQLANMYDVFSSSYRGTDTTSFDAYRESLKRDPVKYFVNMCLSSDLDILSDEEYINNINYITRLFYCVKGTRKIFEYMHTYLNKILDLQEVSPGAYGNYDGRYIEIMFGNITITDENLFYTSLENFFSSLLVFEDLKTNIGTIRMEIKDEITSYISSGLQCYKVFDHIDITEEDTHETGD